MKKMYTLIVLLCIAWGAEAQNYKFQALFMYNIAQRIEWPNLAGEFVIGVIGSKEMHQELESIAQKKQLFGNSIKVVHVNADELSGKLYHVLYLDRSSSVKLGDVKKQVVSKPTLLITDKNGLTGGGINFIDNSSKIEFEIFPTVIKSHQLHLSGSLLNLGIVRE
ncbi:YfiR family protein [Carboxylicivirga linearis]|uniref:YfiR family protein n=1 Tax=Carboxylicivirga linearis TaxID=1628157 RepID=A0ABS5JUY8_9BACT|nr:YfiR family protein [Carboxylicivirga linearis]MBS2098663.1 YfiR family protein [Carboxylicivirga linearis]